ncbi:hypothetical protein M8C21_008225 [Ambrosia artemisiifolia]|uniref:Peptide chain release factor domain-containing protein n=1 Tax=Ambrosia artemisiifolia TaxID=4212 RepID=A0AAD5D1M5_AMBAR|nr:hypothetical protein M8C21_008225 [Ambrosia artemisiifolia]
MFISTMNIQMTLTPTISSISSQFTPRIDLPNRSLFIRPLQNKKPISRTVCMAEPYLLKKLESAEKTWKDLSVKLADPDVVSNPSEYQKLAQSMSELDEVVATYRGFKDCEKQLEESKVLSKDPDVDEEMAEMIASEIESLSDQLIVFEEKLKMLLIPSDPLDSRNILLEVRAGTGGEEAGLWAADLVRMYQRYCERNALRYSPLSSSEAERGGYKTYVMEVKGARVYSKLKYESGVHRVQRVPQTEAQGRIHTSTATVAIMPEVRMSIRYEIKLKEQQESQRNQRKSQVGSGSRSEKIRTYNYKDNRVTDHRLKMNFELTSFLDGDIETAIQSCASMEQRELLEELADSVGTAAR